ncbi:hypothetical protein JK628_14185 [Shewanella sp. KX20019]|uniref:hypothetical protein n=1 Tax=Shewanella sp. KX20019 TaxID=2803864 RepID=UPI00192685D9|nr:hypothetical protein [Shewanella sp. KX20019]QQX78716.1 hypothetical protein JK628_14185 [Shewanella sp. KX20019]
MNRILSILGEVAFCAAFLAWTFYPEIPSSVLGWGVLIIIGIPAYLFLEWLGETVLGSQFFKNRSSFTRVLLGVPVALVLIVVALFVIGFVQQSVNAVGG